MNERCPHCGTVLPKNPDAYCPECRSDLSEAPVVEPLAQSRPVAPSTLGEAVEIWHQVELGGIILALIAGVVFGIVDGSPIVSICLGACMVAAGVLIFLLRHRKRQTQVPIVFQRPR